MHLALWKSRMSPEFKNKTNPKQTNKPLTHEVALIFRAEFWINAVLGRTGERFIMTETSSNFHIFNEKIGLYIKKTERLNAVLGLLALWKIHKKLTARLETSHSISALYLRRMDSDIAIAPFPVRMSDSTCP